MKQEFWEDPIAKEDIHSGCLCCPGTDQKLCIDTRLYSSFGGYRITRDGETFALGDDPDEVGGWDNVTTLEQFELTLPDDDAIDFRIHLDLPLRDAVWQRQGKGNWVLIQSGPGFA